jgi:REP element-mobilizing transposase RayT
MSTVWKIFCEELTHVSKEKNLKIYSFVLMTNHFHLIASTPDANISSCMQRFMHRTSRRLTKAGNRINETFAGRHFKCILQHQNYFLNAYKYNYRNPVAAGLCKFAEDYPYSTLLGKLVPSKLMVPIVEDTLLNSDIKGTLKWINTAPEEKYITALRFGMRHQYFEPRKIKNTGIPSITENVLI